MIQSFRCDRETALVRTTKGLVKGYARDGLLIFKGIPYARARRFHAPQETEAWEGVFDATNYGFVCPLLENERPAAELRVPHRYWPMDENCLNLNIWTPGADDAMRPVLVWLHGGGYYAGSSIEQRAYDGANMSRFGDAVVVSLNHRLNILGYFDLSDFGEEYANSGNAGGDDIIAALRWVRENIAAFGGDPARVTVFGQSGGGAKVTTLLQSPAADGLYARGIVMSGVIGPVLADAVGSGRELAEAVMKKLRLRDVRKLEKVDYRRLAAAYQAISPGFRKEGKYVGCCPHPNAFYRGDPLLNGFREETKDVPLLVGSVFGEFASFAPSPYDRAVMSGEEQIAVLRELIGEEGVSVLLPLFRAAYPERQPIDLLQLDFLFRGPEIAYLAARSRLNRCTWSYLFNLDQPIDNGGSTPWHCCDIPYVFRNIGLVEHPHGPEADPGLHGRVQEQVFESVLAFARCGDPANPAIPAWPPCGADGEHTLLIDAATRVRTDFDHTLIEAQTRYMGPVFERLMREQRVQH